MFSTWIYVFLHIYICVDYKKALWFRHFCASISISSIIKSIWTKIVLLHAAIHFHLRKCKFGKKRKTKSVFMNLIPFQLLGGFDSKNSGNLSNSDGLCLGLNLNLNRTSIRQ